VLDKLELTRVLVVECDLICKCFAHHQHLRCGVGSVDAAPTAQPQPHAAAGAVALAIVHKLLTGCVLDCQVTVEGKSATGGAAAATLLYYGVTTKSGAVKKCGVSCNGSVLRFPLRSNLTL
jgi:hypothetical protein